MFSRTRGTVWNSEERPRRTHVYADPRSFTWTSSICWSWIRGKWSCTVPCTLPPATYTCRGTSRTMQSGMGVVKRYSVQSFPAFMEDHSGRMLENSSMTGTEEWREQPGSVSVLSGVLNSSDRNIKAR